MTCKMCGYEFCWLCSGKWSEHGQKTGGYYNCNKYEEMKKSGKLKKVLVKQDLNPRWERTVKIFGSLFLAIGITIVILIIYSVLFGYK